MLLAGCVLRLHGEAMKAVHRARSDTNDDIILYDLSNKNINCFNLNSYENFYEIH